MTTRRFTIQESGLCAQGGINRSIEEWREWDELFFPSSTGARLRDALAEVAEYCASCPVRRECAAEALDTKAVGVAAGVLVPENGQKLGAWTRLAEIAGVEAPALKGRRTTRGRVGTIPDSVVRAIRAAKRAGDTYPQIEARFGIPKSTAMGIALGKTYKEVV